MNKNSKENNTALFRVAHFPMLQIAVLKLKFRILQESLEKKGLIKANEIEDQYDRSYKEELPRIFNEMEEHYGFKNVKLIFKDNGEILISGLPENHQSE